MLRVAAERLIYLDETILRTEALMSQTMERISREVAETRGRAESAAALIQKLATEIRDRIGNNARLEELADSLDGSQTILAEAIDANPGAPADPEPVTGETDGTDETSGGSL